jgi:hypothetical protein
MSSRVTITESDKLGLLAKLRYYNSEDRRITWEELAQALHTSRRKIRATIHEINADDSNHLVLTDTDEGGYWLAARDADPAPAIAHYWEEDSRALNTLKKVQAMKRKITRLYGAAALDPQSKLQEGLF